MMCQYYQITIFVDVRQTKLGEKVNQICLLSLISQTRKKFSKWGKRICIYLVGKYFIYGSGQRTHPMLKCVVCLRMRSLFRSFIVVLPLILEMIKSIRFTHDFLGTKTCFWSNTDHDELGGLIVLWKLDTSRSKILLLYY